MNAKNIFFICLSIIIFLITFLFLPKEIPFHINFNGEVSQYCNKYTYFVVYVIADVVISYFWNKFINSLKKIKNGIRKDKVGFLFSYAFFLALIIMLTSVFTNFNPTWIGLIGSVIYLIYLLTGNRNNQVS